ncbi:hypothetical protein Tco_0908556 [Tanacetum coccineum]|uniref:Uncharacterized protein n=1 Tax=Tanacetum coccineum TaxID=301880 RepID=A0ABQ5CMJ6_9ASTR
MDLISQGDDDRNYGLLVQVTLTISYPPILPHRHSITKDYTNLHDSSKQDDDLLFEDKLSCSINLNKSIKKLEVDSNHSGRHCEECSERKRNKDVE